MKIPTRLRSAATQTAKVWALGRPLFPLRRKMESGLLAAIVALNLGAAA
ncbi:hypothetical protein PY257_12195 [Ramlibacter sp. H39-3-26]|nr:hypothetical protein [Ramlibacter sp. H39-3-26]MDF1485932.1 hypothetical protein [Ramlibacter sp. H39-3-26]